MDGQTNCDILNNKMVQNTVTFNNLDKPEKYFLSEVKHKILYSFKVQMYDRLEKVAERSQIR